MTGVIIYMIYGIQVRLTKLEARVEQHCEEVDAWTRRQSGP